MATPRHFTSAEAARELGVKLPTLYAYVSRGLIRSEPEVSRTRSRRYNAEDVRKLKSRRERGRSPKVAVRAAFDWGGPVLDSALTLIAERALYYRGLDASDLARDRTLEEIAVLLWTGALSGAPKPTGAEGPGPLFSPSAGGSGDVPSNAVLEPIDRMLAILPLLSAHDPGAYQLAKDRVVEAGLRMLPRLAAAAVGKADPAGAAPAGSGAAGRTTGPAVARTLALAWTGTERTSLAARGKSPVSPGAVRLLDAALILCADHELNTSTLAARCAASTRAPPYGVVMAGMATLQGTRHGGATGRVEALLDEVWASGDPTAVLSARLRRGEGIPGFGHPLYPEGDPRADTLLDLLGERETAAPRLRLANDLADEAERMTGGRPNIDFALATLASTLALPRGAALALFAVGRTVGWIAHAIEQYQLEGLIRPRARYTGPRPSSGHGIP